MNKHDASYRLLFNNPQLVRGLFQGIIQAPWLDALDWARLAPLPTDYVTDRLRQRQGDRVWRLPRCDGHDLYLLLMLEHQSGNDHIMALRMLTYRGLLYENLLQRQAMLAHGALPAVLPLVLYSGAARWSAATEVGDLIEAAPPGMQPYQPQLRYLLVDEGALVQAGGLPPDNLTALLFRLEHNRGIEEVQHLVQTVYDRTQGQEHRELRRAFVSWTRHVLLPRALPEVALPEVDDLLEIKDMLTEHARSWTHQWRQEGLKEGEAALLQRLLAHKFGPLPLAPCPRPSSSASRRPRWHSWRPGR